MFRVWLYLVLAGVGAAQEAPPKKPAPIVKEEIPPEEDESLKPKEYSFNPLQAEHEMTAGNYYFKRGKFIAAASRFREATKWNPTLPESWKRLGEAEEKLHDAKATREAYSKYLEVAPDAKDAEAIKKKIAKL
jgi:tetratricopeptide (TPR) repeat protein